MTLTPHDTLRVPHQERRSRLLERLEPLGADALLVSSPENRFYLTGFTGSAGWVFVGADGSGLVTDGRYWTQAREQCPDVELVEFRAREDKRLSLRLAAWFAAAGWQGRLGFEGRHLTVSVHDELRRDLPAAVELVKVDGLLEDLRQVKSVGELAAIARAADIVDQAFARGMEAFREGVAESDLRAELDYQLHRAGASRNSFDTIVAAGANGALPHASATARPIRAGELVTIDLGAQVDGYCSDMTRTVWLGDLDSTSLEIYRTVRAAQAAAVAAVRPGVRGGDLDALARECIGRAGYGERFSHSLGHGVGLAIHEGPALRPDAEVVLEEGMVVTVEPGIYLPGVTGCRVEDLVQVTSEGSLRLSRTPYQEPGQTHPLEALGVAPGDAEFRGEEPGQR